MLQCLSVLVLATSATHHLLTVHQIIVSLETGVEIMSIVTGRKNKFSVKDFVSNEWAAIRGKLHSLGFLIFENAEKNEVTLVHDVECAAASAVEGNYTGVESDALQAARVLLSTHAPQTETKPTEVKPVVETALQTETKPAETKQAETKPVVKTVPQTETKPAETKNEIV